MTMGTRMTKSERVHPAKRSGALWPFVLNHSFVTCHSSFVSLLLLAGCAVGPNYKRPAIDSPSLFRGDPSPTNNSFADLDWWRVYQDATLQALVREAFTNNYDLRIA